MDSDPQPNTIPASRLSRRRSSLFRPNVAEPSRFYIDEASTTVYSKDYVNQLYSEISSWKTAHQKIKAQYLELKTKPPCTVQPVQINNLPEYQSYIRGVENFCSKVNNLVELHENLRNLHNKRQKELEELVEINFKKMQRKLKV